MLLKEFFAAMDGDTGREGVWRAEAFRAWADGPAWMVSGEVSEEDKSALWVLATCCEKQSTSVGVSVSRTRTLKTRCPAANRSICRIRSGRKPRLDQLQREGKGGILATDDLDAWGSNSFRISWTTFCYRFCPSYIYLKIWDCPHCAQPCVR